jgi:NAD(P)-dependent dehydrogenase (short-subunit alcohol dehydrogenase family)
VALGGQVCVSARRADKLDEVCREAGGGHAIAADASDPDSCARLVREAAAHLGGLDLVLYAAGAAVVSPLADATADDWRRAYEVNVVGPNLVCAAALGVLAPDGLVAFISSESTSETRWGMGTYSASKAALDASIRNWRLEHPERRFQRIIMGATMPTEFGAGFPADVLETALNRWMAAGISMTAMETDDVGRHLAEVMSVILAHPAIDVPDIYLDPRGLASS